MTTSSTTPDQPDDVRSRVFVAPEGEPAFRLPPGARRRRRLAGISPVSLLLALAGAVAIAGVAFAVGRTTAGTVATTSTGAQTGTVPGANGAAPGGIADGQGDDANRFRIGGTQTVSGTVVGLSNGTLTLQLADGQTVQLTVGSSTTYHAQAAASASDVTTGSTVIVSVNGLGRPGDDVSGLTASDITVAGS